MCERVTIGVVTGETPSVRLRATCACARSSPASLCASAHDGMRSSGVIELGDDVPLVVEIVDRADRIEPLLPEIATLV